ncbi:MAG TPA: DUF721 domain-containing protein [Actinomycetota bacterium]
MARSGRRDPWRKRDPSSGSKEPAHLRDLLRGFGAGSLRQGLQLGRLIRAWPEVAGEELAAHSMPVALTAQGLVVKATAPAWAAQVRFLIPQLRARAEPVIGRKVPQVRVVVGPLEGPSEPGSAGRR